jgi:flagellar biosynthesis/type III secretory pathway protein FliH
LTKRLYNKGFDQTQIKNLYLFIDWIIKLPKPLEIEYHEKIYQFEEDRKMAYISTAERLGIEKGFSQGISQGLSRGISQGKQEGEVALLTRLLTRKFGLLPKHYQKKIATTDADTLLEWGERVLSANTLEEIFK